MKILKIMLASIILSSFILIGTPIKYNCLELNIVIILIGSVFMIFNIFTKKLKFSKIDLITFILYITPIIPLIFNTYSSLAETLVTLIRNISLFNIYIMVKEVIEEKEKNTDFLTNTLIIGGIILIIFGIDEMTTKMIYNHINLLGIPQITNYETRMFSAFGYANSFAIVMAIESLICFHKIKTNKYYFSGLIFIFLSGLWLSYSRSVIAIFGLTFITYIFISCIFQKKSENVYLLYLFAINLILACIYAKIFEICVSNKQYIVIWLLIVLFAIISIGISKLLSEKYEEIKKIKTKTYLKILIGFVLIICTLYIIGIKLDKPLTLFDSEKNSQNYRRDIRNVETNTDYCFTFEIKANSRLKDEENYSIEIVEENKYYDTIKTHKIKFNNYEGKKDIKFKTSSETVNIVIFIKNNIKVAQKGLTINKLTINGKKQALSYLYLPLQIVEKIESFQASDKSVWERAIFHKDSFKIIRENPLLGAGGKGWLYNYEKIQSYNYGSTEAHSYLLQIWIENGIIAVIAFIIILIYVAQKMIKKNKRFDEIDIAFILLTLHSFIDFDLSFYCIMVIWVILFTLVIKDNRDYEDSKEKNISKITPRYMFLVGIICVNIVTLILGIFTFRLKKYNENILSNIDICIENEEFNKSIELIRIYNKNEKYNKFYNKLSKIDYKDVEYNYIEYLYEQIEKQPLLVDTQANLQRRDVILKIIETSQNEEIVSKFANIIIKENEEMIYNIKNKEKNRLRDDEIRVTLEEQERIYDLVLEKYYNKFYGD